MPNPDHSEQQPEDADILEARSGSSDLFGKLDDDIPPIRVNGDFLVLLKRNAAAAGYPLAEYVRNKLYVAELGLDHVLSLREKQFRGAMVNASQKKGDAA